MNTFSYSCIRAFFPALLLQLSFVAVFICMPSSGATDSFHIPFFDQLLNISFLLEKKMNRHVNHYLRLHTWDKVIRVMSNMLTPEQGNVLMQRDASATGR